MERIFDEYLSDLITLTNIKMVDQPNKKLISSCIFIPENPKITMKTPNYFTGLIKSIETFSKRMEPGWIYRLYVDEMFLKAIKSNDVVQLAEHLRKGDEPVLEDISYSYAYNNLKSDSNKSANSNSPNTKKTKKRKRIIKDNIKMYSCTLKKLLKLLNLYLKNIITSKEKKYENIEIVSFRCDMASVSGKYPGHSSTFGSIIRFFPMFDSTVDMFVSVNSRYPLNPLLTEIITTWANNDDKRMLTYTYETGFIEICILQNINRPLVKIRDNGLKKHDSELVDAINDIYKMKQNLFDDPEELLADFTPKKSFRDKNNILPDGFMTSGAGHKYLYEMETKLSIGAGLFGMKRDYTLFRNRITIFSKLLRYFIQTKNRFKFGIDEVFLKLVLAFEAGTHDIDGDNYIKYRKTGYNKIAKMTKGEVNTWAKTNEINYKKLGEIDGVGLADMTFEKLDKLGFSYKNTDKIMDHIKKLGSIKVDYIMNLMYNNNPHYFPSVLFDVDTSYISNSKGESLILKNDFVESETGMHIYKKNFINDYIIDERFGLDLYQIGIYQSRSLLHTKGKVQLKEREPINYKYSTTGLDGIENIDNTMSHLLSTFDEYKKLYLIDSVDDNRLNELMFNVKDIDKYYTIVDLKNYPLNKTDDLLKLLVDYYSQEFIQYTPLKVAIPKPASNGDSYGFTNSNNSKTMKNK